MLYKSWFLKNKKARAVWSVRPIDEYEVFQWNIFNNITFHVWQYAYINMLYIIT